MGRLGPPSHALWRPARPTLLCMRRDWGLSVPMDPWGPRLSLFGALRWDSRPIGGCRLFVGVLGAWG
eukprot:9652712-Alexandrium_andersonii.AAC.1